MAATVVSPIQTTNSASTVTGPLEGQRTCLGCVIMPTTSSATAIIAKGRL
jgi:hypothetical protein